MSALSHVLESEGLSTTGISLVREHTEAMAPPRALWVPFALGRPLGAAGDAAFQHRVIAAALATWHALAMRRRGRTGAGVSRLTVEQCLELVIEAGRTGATDDVRGLKAAVEDLKAYYVEAVTARPGAPPAGAIDAMLWDGSALGRLLRRLAARGADSDHAAMRFFATDSLVPRRFR